MTVNGSQNGRPCQTAAAQLRSLLQGDHIIMAPGVYDGITGRGGKRACSDQTFVVAEHNVCDYSCYQDRLRVPL
jgi:hypothetical protein